jgi:hypothetical protein
VDVYALRTLMVNPLEIFLDTAMSDEGTGGSAIIGQNQMNLLCFEVHIVNRKLQ